jgi:uncharacterized protein (DUF1330 family)
MAGYMIANVEVTDAARFEEYRQKVGAVVAQFGGRFIVLGGDVRCLEGHLPIRRLVVVEFPSLDAAQRFYDSSEYQPLLKIRLASTKSDVVLAAGYWPSATDAQPRRFSDLKPGNRKGSA